MDASKKLAIKEGLLYEYDCIIEDFYAFAKQRILATSTLSKEALEVATDDEYKFDTGLGIVIIYLFDVLIIIFFFFFVLQTFIFIVCKNVFFTRFYK